jgi:integrase/recombinase XerD
MMKNRRWSQALEHVHKAIEDFLNHCKFEKKLSDKTLKAYGIDLQQFLLHLSDGSLVKDLREVDKQLLSNYLELLYSKGKPKTIKRKVATLRAFFNYLEFEDRVVVSPFRKMSIKIEQEQTAPEILSHSEIEMLLRYIYKKRQDSRYHSEIRQKAIVRDIAILELLLETGMRVSEVCSLKKEDVDLQENRVKIEGRGMRRRTIPLVGDAVIRAINDYAVTHQYPLQSSTYWFLNRDSKQISDQSIRSMITKYCQAAGITKNITPHTFRHTLANMLVESGWDVRAIQYFLGHATMMPPQFQVHVNEEAQRDFLQNNHPRSKIEIDRPVLRL